MECPVCAKALQYSIMSPIYPLNEPEFLLCNVCGHEEALLSRVELDLQAEQE